MIRVLVVDDHEIVRRGLIELLNGYDGLEAVSYTHLTLPTIYSV